MDFRLHHATENELPIILSLINDLAEYVHLSYAVVATQEILRVSLFERRAAEVVIGYAGDEPAGFAVFYRTFSTFLGVPGMYLEDLFVIPRFRRHGLGRQLLTHLARIAGERGYGRIEWSVLDWNEPAIEFYKRLGATVLPDWRICRMTAEQFKTLGEM